MAEIHLGVVSVNRQNAQLHALLKSEQQKAEMRKVEASRCGYKGKKVDKMERENF